MGRLIESDKLKADLEKAILENGDMDCLDFLRIASLIDAQPTAYDVDAVVEQIKKEFLMHKPGEGFILVNVWNNALNKAIEIVKGGCNANSLIDRAKSKSGERIPYDGKWK